GLELGDQLTLLFLIATDEAAGQVQLHRERHQLLLSSVVDVALDAATLLVLRGDQALPGRLELLDQPDVSEDQPGLRGEVLDELLLRWSKGIARRHVQRNGTEQVALVPDGERAARPGHVGKVTT